MSLTEIMSNAGLSRYAEPALLLFFFAFILIVVRLFRPSKRAALEQQAKLPLQDDPHSPRSHNGSDHG